MKNALYRIKNYYVIVTWAIYALPFKSMGSVRFFYFCERNDFIQQRCIKLIKRASNDFYYVTNK